MVSFKEQAYEIAFGDDAINKGYTEQEVLGRLREFCDASFNHQDLELSDYEKGYLMAFSHQSYDDWCDTNREPEDIWYGVQVGDRVFDINLWRDEANDMVYCSVYECIKGLEQPDNYTTDADRWFRLWERKDA